MEIPEGFANVRHVFSLIGRIKPMGWSHGVQTEVGVSALQVASSTYQNFVEAFLPSTGAMLAGWTYIGTEVTKTFAGQPERGTWGPPIVGSGGANGLIVNSALLIQKHTGVGGRKNRGRAFIPPFNIPENSVDQAGFVAPADVTNQQAGYSSYHGKCVADTLPCYLFHSSPADPPTLITSFVVSGQVATQRRRMR